MPPIARRALLAGAALPLAAHAQGTPLRMVVPFAPGGATDIAARLVVPALAEALSRPVVIENRGGGGTLIGAEAVATAAPDGNTIGFFTVTTAALAAGAAPEAALRHPPRLRARCP
ncbi:tripartite tricarboxylate transporter substrate-binding protein [Dankookia sp. P2]|uniref:tripartite tricarboxylate transporter substrate-binding protein n=1 Tax=Dankookia sp. P2 TaxID=3423955 RepID=UPI003D663F9E